MTTCTEKLLLELKKLRIFFIKLIIETPESLLLYFAFKVHDTINIYIIYFYFSIFNKI